jgi:DNA-binding XRE family transcriptional regulator
MARDQGGTIVELSQGAYLTTVIRVPKLGRLRGLRERAALTQIDLADRSGVARSTIIRLEKGEPHPNPTTIRKLARALRVKPYELWEESPSSN